VDTLPVGGAAAGRDRKALRRGAGVLILDEPTAVLTPQEWDELFGVLRRLCAQGVTIVPHHHKLPR
jgi:simple sugar transport system ATP-binding protein